MKFWWIADPGRLATEIEAVDTAVGEGWFQLSAWRLVTWRLAAEGVIVAHGVEYHVRLVYPDQFPMVPAWVEPQDPEVRWSQHQYGKGGTLCLELRPDNWVPSATGGDVLRSAHNLLRVENPLGTGDRGSVPSGHHVGAIQAYDFGPNPVFIGEGCFERILSGQALGVRAIRWLSADDVWPILVCDAADDARESRPPGPDLWAGRREVPVCIAMATPPDEIPVTRSGLAGRLGLDLKPDRYPDGLLLLAVDGGNVAAYHSTDPDSVYKRVLIPIPDDAGARSGRGVSDSRKRVAIIGVGSVGSKVAESLVRSGVNELVLADGDVMLPGNLERHTLDWRDVGFRKVSAVRRRLLNIRPGAEITALPGNLNWQRSARQQSAWIDALAECDLLIDATGDVPTSLFLGAIAATNEKPFVSVEVLEGGAGFILARSVPQIDGTYAAGRASLLAYCEHQAVPTLPSGTRPYEALAGDGSPVVADDAAVSAAAAHTARAAIDLLHGPPEEGSPAWLLVGLRREWIFEGHGSTIGLRVPPETDEAPPESTAGEAAVQRAQELVLRLVAEVEDEASSTA